MYEMYITAILEIIEVGFYFRIISPHSREVCGPRRFHWLYVPLLRTPMLQSRSRCLASAPDGNARRTLAIANRRSIRRSAWRYLIDPTSLRKSAVLLRVRLASLTGSFRNRVDGLPVVTGMLPCDDSSGKICEVWFEGSWQESTTPGFEGFRSFAGMGGNRGMYGKHSGITLMVPNFLSVGSDFTAATAATGFYHHEKYGDAGVDLGAGNCTFTVSRPQTFKCSFDSGEGRCVPDADAFAWMNSTDCLRICSPPAHVV